MIPPIVRFAPSPTGLIHIGNARTALLNALFARRAGGTFILRFDDTDVERSTRAYADAIETDLAWLGIPPDRSVRQSDRFALYDAVAARLKALGQLYACYETPDELERRRKRQLARGLPPVYDRAALSLTDADKERLETEGRRPHCRERVKMSGFCSTSHVRF
jgi:glutamyl-tRNA synthetase